MAITWETTKYIYVKVQDLDIGKQYTLKVNHNDARRLRLRKIKAVVQKIMKSISENTPTSFRAHNTETWKNNEINKECSNMGVSISNNNNGNKSRDNQSITMSAEIEKSEKASNKEKEIKKKKKKKLKSSFDLYCGTVKLSNEKMYLEEIMQQCQVYQEYLQRSSNATKTSLLTKRSSMESENTFTSSQNIIKLNENSNNITRETYEEKHSEELLEELCILTIHRHTAYEQKQSNDNKEKIANNHEKYKVNENNHAINASHYSKQHEIEKYKRHSVNKENEHNHIHHRPPLAPPSPVNGGTPREQMTRTTPSPLALHQSGKIVVENSQNEEGNHVICTSDKTTLENKETVHHLTSSLASCKQCEQEQQLLVDENDNYEDNSFYGEDAESKASITVSVSSDSESEIDYEFDNENSNRNNGNLDDLSWVKSTYEYKEEEEEPAHIIYNSATLSKINKQIVQSDDKKTSSIDNTTNHSNDANHVTEYIEHLENQVKELQEKLQLLQCKTNESKANVIS